MPSIFFKVLAARKIYLISARARKNKRTARMLASSRKDHSIPLQWFQAYQDQFCGWFSRRSTVDCSSVFFLSHFLKLKKTALSLRAFSMINTSCLKPKII